MTDKLRDALEKLHQAVCGETGFAAAVRQESGKAYPWPALDIADDLARAALAAAPQPAPEDGLTRAQVGAMLDAKRHDREALVEVIREAWQSHEAALRAVLAERDALQGQLNDLRNGWANSVKAHADALAERDALDAIASKLQHDHDMMALANGKLEAERDAAFAAGQESMRERSLAEIALMREDCHPPRTPLVAAVPIWLDVAALRIRQLPIKPCPE